MTSKDPEGNEYITENRNQVIYLKNVALDKLEREKVLVITVFQCPAKRTSLGATGQGVADDRCPTFRAAKAVNDNLDKEHTVKSGNNLIDYMIGWNRCENSGVGCDGELCQGCRPWNEKQEIEAMRSILPLSVLCKMNGVKCILFDASGSSTGPRLWWFSFLAYHGGLEGIFAKNYHAKYSAVNMRKISTDEQRTREYLRYSGYDILCNHAFQPRRLAVDNLTLMTVKAEDHEKMKFIHPRHNLRGRGLRTYSVNSMTPMIQIV